MSQSHRAPLYPVIGRMCARLELACASGFPGDGGTSDRRLHRSGAGLSHRDRAAQVARRHGRHVPVQHRGGHIGRLSLQLFDRWLAAGAGRVAVEIRPGGPAGFHPDNAALHDPAKPALAGAQGPPRRGKAGPARDRARAQPGRRKCDPAASAHGERKTDLGQIQETHIAGLRRRRLQSIGRHQRHSLLHQRYLRLGWIQQSVRRPASDRDRGDEFPVHTARALSDRPHRAKNPASDRIGGPVRHLGRHGCDPDQRPAPGMCFCGC